jgi:5'-nucleotidase
VKGLSFAGEAATVNALVPEIQAKGAAAIVLLVHEGGTQTPKGTYDACDGFSGDILPIVEALSPAVQVVVSAHTHQAYDCTIAGRLVTSAGSYGRLVTKIDLAIDPTTGKIVAKQARNVPVTRDVPPDPEVEGVIAKAEDDAKAITKRVVGWVERDWTGNAKMARSRSCETPLGDLIADAQRDATGADVALMNPGGIRADLVASGPAKAEHAITYGEAFEVQPFGGHLVTMTLRGDQLRSILEGQFGQKAEPRILQVSSGFSYRYVYDRATRHAAIEGLKLKGAPVDPKKEYRVTVNSFLAGGGDSFPALTQGTERKDGPGDLEAFTTYMGKRSTQTAPLTPPAALDRIEGNGCE